MPKQAGQKIIKTLKMKITQLFSLLTISLLLLFTACDDNSTGVEEPVSDIEVQQVEDLEADGDNTHYTFFSLRTGQEVQVADSASTDWDIAFKGTTVIFNSGVSGPGEAGAVGLDVNFDQVEMAPSEGYRADGDAELAIPTGGGNGWYTYTGNSNPPHAVLPLEDYTIIVKTADGNHFAKVEMISYYEGNPDTSTEEFASLQTRPAGGYFTFRYAVQQTEDLRDLN